MVLVAGNFAFGIELSLIFGDVCWVDEGKTTGCGDEMQILIFSVEIVSFVDSRVILPFCYSLEKGSVTNLEKDFVIGQTWVVITFWQYSTLYC